MGFYADRCKAPSLIAVRRGLLLWVESGPLRHVPELFLTAHYTG